MKTIRHLFILVTLLAFSVTLWAQPPQAFTYQAVVRNASSQLVRNAQVGVRLTIRQTTSTGNSVYCEIHTPTTNDNGLFTVYVGRGTVQSGVFSDISWGTDDYFLCSEIDPDGGTAYSITGSQQLLSVPYALYCGETQDLSDVTRRGNHAGMRQLKDVQDPTDPQDAVTKYHLDSVINAVMNIINTPRRDTSATVCGSFTWNRTGETYTSSGVYNATLEHAGCGGSCDSVIVLRLTVRANPSRTLVKSFCGDSYLWAVSGENSTHGTGGSYTTSQQVIGPEYDGGNGCTGADTLRLTILTPPSITGLSGSASPATVCPGGNSRLTASATNVDGDVAYTWTKVSGSATPTAGSGSYIDLSNITTNSAYTLTATVSREGCTPVVDNFAVGVEVFSTTDVIDQQVVCLTNLPFGWNGETYNEDVTPDDSHDAKIEITDENGCTVYQKLQLSVLDTPSVVLNTPSPLGSVCPNSDVELATTVMWRNGSLSYAWSVSPTANAGLPNDADALNVTVTPTVAGTYTYTLTATASIVGCSDVTHSKDFVVVVDEAPSVTITTQPQSEDICSGGSTDLSAVVVSDGSLSYQWLLGDSPISNATSATLDNVTTGGNYTLRITSVSDENCTTVVNSNPAEVAVQVPSLTLNDILANSVPTTSKTVNANDAVTLAANVGSHNGSLSYEWSTSSSFTDVLGTNSTYSPSTSSAGTTTYYLRVTNTTDAGCETSAIRSIDVTVEACNFNPTLSFTSASYSGGSNSNIPVEVSVGTLDGGSNGGYSWEIVSSTAPGAVINSGTYSYQKNVYATGAGTVTIRCTMHATKGACAKDVSATATVTVTACSVTLTAINITRTGRGSGGECANIPFALTCTPTYTPSNATVTYQWKRGGPSSTQPSDYGYSNISSTYGIAGATSKICYVKESNGSSGGQTFWYDCEVTVSYGGCSVTKTKKQLTSLGLNVGIYSNGGTGTTYTNSTSSNQSLSRSGTTLTFGSKTASSTYNYVVWFAIPNNTESSNPSNVLWRCFSASNTSKGSGTATVPSSGGGKVYYFNSKNSNTGTCPTSSGTYQATSIVTSPKTYN